MGRTDLDELYLNGVPILPALGGVITGHAFFVYSGTGVDGSGHDGSKDLPFATLDYAIGMCTANNGDVIFLMPGHNEGYGSAQGFDADVAGITIVNLGTGADAATFDFDNATAKCIIGANSVRILGKPRFRPSVTAVAIGIDIETGVTDTKLDVDLVIGEDGSGTDEFIKGIHLTSGNHDTDLSESRLITHASAGQSTHAVHIDAASNRCKFDGIIIQGPWSTGGIIEDAAGLNHEIVGASIDTTGTNYGFNAGSTFAKRFDNLDAGAPEDSGANFIGRDDADNAVATTNVVANADGSVLERVEYLQSVHVVPTADVATNTLLRDVVGNKTDAAIYDKAANKSVIAYLKGLVSMLAGTDGIATFPASAVPGNAVSMAEVLRDAWDVLRNGTGGSEPATNKSIIDALGFDGSAFVAGGLGMYLPRCVAKTDGAVLSGDDPIFTITGGPVRAKIVGLVTTIIGGAANGKLRITTTTPAATVDMNAGAVAIDNDAAGTSYRNIGATSVFTPVTAGMVIIDPVTVEDCEFLLPIGTVNFNSSAAQSGVIAWYMTYWPLSPASVVVAAA